MHWVVREVRPLFSLLSVTSPKFRSENPLGSTVLLILSFLRGLGGTAPKPQKCFATMPSSQRTQIVTDTPPMLPTAALNDQN